MCDDDVISIIRGDEEVVGWDRIMIMRIMPY